MGGRVRNGWLALIAVPLVLLALRASYAVTMPIAVAAVVIAAVWPVEVWLRRVLPERVSSLGTILVLLVTTLGFIAALYFSAAQVVQAFARRWAEFESAYESATAWADRWGLPLGGKEGYARLIAVGQDLLGNAYTISVYLAFIALLVVLGLPEIPTLRRKLQEAFGADKRSEVAYAADEIAGKIRGYLATTTLTSIITGVASALWALAMGLDLALVWGTLNFLLNYIPVVGNLVGIVPPSLYAVVQFPDSVLPIVIFVGFGAIQFTVSNVIYPVLQGRSVSLSPVVVVVALAVWGWVWGVAGMLVAIPLTVAFVIVCEQFPRTRWIAILMSGSR
ncbi:AI-2E family transporter [Methylobacterium segetis]|uniref:AI-2E family transporter n=1 Tax=Methylobacterium segetis TaxID=2488750 RepID=UPI001404DAF6|nr:AI-2E family transporter [Methylobacterium segetis]